MTESFWAIPDTKNLRTPVTILKEQAEALTRATNGVLEGSVETFPANQPNFGWRLRSCLTINVPFLKDYAVNILTYSHNITMYPGILNGDYENGFSTVENEEEFVSRIKEILSSRTTMTILANLISQAEAA